MKRRHGAQIIWQRLGLTNARAGGTAYEEDLKAIDPTGSEAGERVAQPSEAEAIQDASRGRPRLRSVGNADDS
jgi:hypothetical protein